MKIGELAEATSCPIETIRYYERSGLLAAPGRSAGNYRVYNADHQERLAFIRHCRLLDISLEEIRRLLHFRDSPDEACDEVNAMLDTHLADVRTRIASMLVLETQLVTLRSRCSQTQQAALCGILHELGHVT
ncbi:Cd(II)/Pb(II)-responsive transcriptional regulator [Massilia sp. SR12]